MVNKKTQWIATTAMLSAVVVVLQAVSYWISSFGLPFGITLTLVPILFGAITYGPKTGAVLGAVLGAVVCVCVMTGIDKLGYFMFQYNPIMTLLVCMAKSTVAGFISGIIAKCFKKKEKVGTFIASVACPVINTGVFMAVVVAVFVPVIEKVAETAIIPFVTGVLLTNFLPELIINIILTPAVLSTSKVLKKR